ncbi:MAG: hypothetical protein R2864_15415 [Syntrophotaleaceae bacterium]
MKNAYIAITAVFLCLSLGSFACAEIAENQGLFHQRIKLYTGDSKDSYLLLYPIEVTQPGRVDFEFKLLQPDQERYQRAFEKARQQGASVFRWTFVDSRFFDQKKPMQPGKFQQWVNEVNNYNPVEYVAGDQIRGFVGAAKATLDHLFGKKKKKKEVPAYMHRYSQSVRFPDTPENRITAGRMHYDIDFQEISETQGMYFLVLENFSQLTSELEVKVSFPGKQYQVDSAFTLPRDLGITLLRADKDSVTVEITNLGQGEITDDIYGRKGPDALTLMLSLNGKSWGGATLAGLDPDKRLQKPGGKASYTFKVKVPENTEVSAALRMPRFEDADPDNNGKNYRHGKFTRCCLSSCRASNFS